MPYTSNKQAFLQQLQPNHLFDAYRILIVVELAMKDGGLKAGKGGHDVPSMLSHGAQRLLNAGQNTLAAQLVAHEARLRTDLSQLWCTEPNGSGVPVPQYSYPYARYTRHQGEWAGVAETLGQAIADLAQTCQGLLAFLQANGAAMGVQL